MKKKVLPKTCEMPDLSDLETIIPGFMTSLLAFEGKRLTKNEHQYYRIFMRLENKALASYQAAREAMVSYVENRENIFAITFDFVDHMENCLNSARRLYGVLQRVRREKGAGLSIERIQFKALNRYFDGTTPIRNVIEHLDEHVQDGTLADSVVLTISEDDKHVEIGGFSISFENLANVIRKFHEFARAWQDDFVKQD